MLHYVLKTLILICPSSEPLRLPGSVQHASAYDPQRLGAAEAQLVDVGSRRIWEIWGFIGQRTVQYIHLGGTVCCSVWIANEPLKHIHQRYSLHKLKAYVSIKSGAVLIKRQQMCWETDTEISK